MLPFSFQEQLKHDETILQAIKENQLFQALAVQA
jgi:hypothetical protein